MGEMQAIISRLHGKVAKEEKRMATRTSTPLLTILNTCSPEQEEVMNSKILKQSVISKIAKWIDLTHTKHPKLEKEGRVLIELANHLEQWNIKHEKSTHVRYRLQNTENRRTAY